MKDYSAQIKGIIEGDEDPQEDDDDFIFPRKGSEANLSDASSIWHLESIRSHLMSRLSREDVMSGLRIVNIPEVYSDPPVFSIRNYLRDPIEDRDEIEALLKRYE